MISMMRVRRLLREVAARVVGVVPALEWDLVWVLLSRAMSDRRAILVALEPLNIGRLAAANLPTKISELVREVLELREQCPISPKRLEVMASKAATFEAIVGILQRKDPQLMEPEAMMRIESMCATIEAWSEERAKAPERFHAAVMAEFEKMPSYDVGSGPSRRGIMVKREGKFGGTYVSREDVQTAILNAFFPSKKDDSK